MERIYKYRLEPKKAQLLELPEDAEILSVAEQRDQIVIYAKVNPNVEETHFHMVWTLGTGHDIDPAVFEGRIPHFLGTVSLMEGHLMYHVFAEK